MQGCSIGNAHHSFCIYDVTGGRGFLWPDPGLSPSCCCAAGCNKRQRTNVVAQAAAAEPKVMLANGLVDYYEILGVSECSSGTMREDGAAALLVVVSRPQHAACVQ